MNLADLLKKSLDSALLDLIHRVADESSALGFPLYLVGGSVRDLLLARPIVDIDLTVEGDAIQLGRALVKKHGGDLTAHEKFYTATWTFSTPVSNLPSLDLISARKETYSHPGALPTVTKSTIDDDLRRRDFTINAMGIRVDGDYFGELYDPLGGQKDLEAKIICILHDKSFVEDPTRMFRAARYSMRYSFMPDSKTHKALFDKEAWTVLSQLSGERIRHEFDLIFEEKRSLLALAVLEDVGLPKVVHPALEKTRALSLSYMREKPEGFGEIAIPDILSFKQTLGWILWLMYLTKTEIESIADRLAFPVQLTNAAQSASVLVKDMPSFKAWKPSQWTFALEKMPLAAIYGVYLMTNEKRLLEFLSTWRHIKPITTGDDLKARGLEPGPKYGEILRRLRAAWLDGEVKNQNDELRLLNEILKEGAK